MRVAVNFLNYVIYKTATIVSQHSCSKLGSLVSLLPSHWLTKRGRSHYAPVMTQHWTPGTSIKAPVARRRACSGVRLLRVSVRSAADLHWWVETETHLLLHNSK